MASERRLAVVDLGSNSFRVVVFTATPTWWRRTDEIYEPVRVGEGLEAAGALQKKPMERALETIDLFAHFCRALGVDDTRFVATSAIREASNQAEFLAAAKERSGVDVEVLSREDEARYGYLAAVNSTTLDEGVALDLGGGSMQLVQVAGRRARDMRSWALGAVRMTERFLSNGGNGGKAKPKHLKALRSHVCEELGSAPWLGEHADGRRLVGIGGTIRNLAAAAMLARDLPTFGVQGYRVSRDELAALVDRFCELSPQERGRVPGIKPERGDLILAGAVVVQTVMDLGGFDEFEATEAGLREGVFFESLLEGQDQPLIGDVRGEAVHNLASEYQDDLRHPEHVRHLAVQIWDGLAEQGVHPGEPAERELLGAAALLHDIGTAVDYDDHHKHSRYLILNAGLPGFSPRETALIGQMARYHRKGNPGLGEIAPLAEDGDEELVARCSAVLRVAEQLERARDQTVRDARVEANGDKVWLELDATDDATIARWGAARQSDLFERAFGRTLTVR
jgi:exopolyphosphatase/guanosine-5'-triphosphate,3'-diphosphate pyrophosphatase